MAVSMHASKDVKMAIIMMEQYLTILLFLLLSKIISYFRIHKSMEAILQYVHQSRLLDLIIRTVKSV